MRGEALEVQRPSNVFLCTSVTEEAQCTSQPVSTFSEGRPKFSIQTEELRKLHM